MPFVPFTKGGGKAAKTAKTAKGKKKPAKGNPFAENPAANQPKKTRRSPF